MQNIKKENFCDDHFINHENICKPIINKRSFYDLNTLSIDSYLFEEYDSKYSTILDNLEEIKIKFSRIMSMESEIPIDGKELSMIFKIINYLLELTNNIKMKNTLNLKKMDEFVRNVAQETKLNINHYDNDVREDDKF